MVAAAGRPPYLTVCTFILALTMMPARLLAQHFPEPNPPVRLPSVQPDRVSVLVKPGAPTTEWINHKSTDGSDPSGAEQKMLWLMNRARSDPTAEGIWLAESTDPDVAEGRNFFNVDLDMLKSDFHRAHPPDSTHPRIRADQPESWGHFPEPWQVLRLLDGHRETVLPP